MNDHGNHVGPSATPSQLTPQRIMEMAWGYAPPLIIEAAVRNRIFDVLDGGPKTIEQISADTGASARGVRAIVQALVGFRLLSASANAYSLTPESSAFLVSSKPGFQGGIFRHVSTQLLPNWMNLWDVVRSGKPAERVNEIGEGSAFFQELVRDIFPMSYPSAKLLADSLTTLLSTGTAEVLDIAAGSGVWGIAIAQRWPNVRVTAVDWPGVTPITLEVAKKHGVGDRVRVISGDILQADLGSNYRLATLGHILHSEGRERSKSLLRRVFDALGPGGSIAIAEFVVNADRNGPPNALIFAVNMLVNTGAGDTYSFEEMNGWLKEAGFMNMRQLQAPGPSPLLLADKPS